MAAGVEMRCGVEVCRWTPGGRPQDLYRKSGEGRGRHDGTADNGCFQRQLDDLRPPQFRKTQAVT